MSRVLRGTVAAVAALSLVTLAAGCGSGSGTPASGSTASAGASSSAGGTSAASSSKAPNSPASSSAVASAAPVDGTTLNVSAAASLKATFTQIGTIFQEQNPGTTVAFNFAGSSDLVTQLTGGLPGDVFASADTANMTKAADADLLAGEPVNFATNTLTVVTKPGNPKGITSFADLANADLAVVVCAAGVPCGSAAQRVQANTGVTLTPVSEENSVTDVLGKVTSGDADAGLVYVTDARTAGDKVTEVDFPEAAQVVNVYPIATLAEAAQPELAGRFVALVTGPEGQQVLAAAGFQPAP
jgi:molybdate transport system substrate-binding protein